MIQTFNDATEFLKSVKDMSQNQKERMLLDLAWKLWNPNGNTPVQLAIQSYHTAKLVV